MDNGGRGGWIPVVKQRARQLRSNSLFENQRASLFTLFVDNLPESMVPRRLHDLFNKFGVVKDVLFHKREGKQQTPNLADVAEQKANGLWVDDKSLSVKVAEYSKGRVDSHRKNLLPPRFFEPLKASTVAQNQIWQQRTDGRSFAEVIKGAEPSYQPVTTIKVDEIRNGWLYESMIMRLKTPYSVLQVRKEIINKGAKNILVRERGGRDAIISFSSKEEMVSKMTLFKSWIHDWCEYITEWRSGMYLQQERCVWVTFYGVPLNLWNSDTFRKIGRLWGEVVLLNGDVSSPKSFHCGRFKIVTNVMNPINTNLNLECKGRIYPIRVLEELISEEDSISSVGLISNATAKEACSNINGVLSLPAKPSLVREDVDKAVDVVLTSNVDADKAAEGGSLSHVSAVEETRDYADFSNETSVGVVESSLPVVSQHQGQCNHEIQNGVEAQFVGNTQQSVGGTHEVQNGALASAVHDHNLTPGFIKSLSQPLKDRPGIQLEIALGHNSFGPLPIRPSSFGLKLPSARPICASSWRDKRKRIRREGLKHCLLAGKFFGFARRIGQKGVTSNKGVAKSSRSRSAALPVLIHNPVLQQPSDRGFVQEAQSILQMGQRLGLEFKGQESEIIRELVQIEERDKERLERGKGIVE
ncbi:hypothetical protein ACSBR2_029205 [Camellia fascicularis]